MDHYMYLIWCFTLKRSSWSSKFVPNRSIQIPFECMITVLDINVTILHRNHIFPEYLKAKGERDFKANKRKYVHVMSVSFSGLSILHILIDWYSLFIFDRNCCQRSNTKNESLYIDCKQIKITFLRTIQRKRVCAYCRVFFLRSALHRFSSPQLLKNVHNLFTNKLRT